MYGYIEKGKYTVVIYKWAVNLLGATDNIILFIDFR